jgi:photosystem II stability/assembly factor-like uncharacterized protein
MAVVALPDGRLLAADQQQGLLESDDEGKNWRSRLRARFLGLAVNPSDPKLVLATGAGIALSRDGGRNWLSALDLAKGAGPVAWSSSDPKVAYAVGFNRRLYRSGDRGVTWMVVQPGR